MKKVLIAFCTGIVCTTLSVSASKASPVFTETSTNNFIKDTLPNNGNNLTDSNHIMNGTNTPPPVKGNSPLNNYNNNPAVNGTSRTDTSINSSGNSLNPISNPAVNSTSTVPTLNNNTSQPLNSPATLPPVNGANNTTQPLNNSTNVPPTNTTIPSSPTPPPSK